MYSCFKTNCGYPGVTCHFSQRSQKDLCFLKQKKKKKKKEEVILTLKELPLCITYENVTFKSLCKM